MVQQNTSDPLVVLGRAAANLKLDNLPAEVIMRAKQRVLDTVGCLVAGYDAGIAEEVRSFVLSQGGSPEATLLPGGQKTTVSLACLAHATYMHGLELTDAAPRGTVHPGNEIGNGLVRHCHFPVPKWLGTRGIGQSWEWVTEVKPCESWKYDAIGKPLWSKAEGFITLTPTGAGTTRLDFIERYWAFNPWMEKLGLEGGNVSRSRSKAA